jgi:HAD superfamily hydrolase (TIGR01509 family)
LPAFNHLAAISFDLDDTLWPVTSLIARAEAAGMAWFEQHAPLSLPHLAPANRRALRQRTLADLSDSDPRRSDMRYLRQRLYQLALQDSGYDENKALEAFLVFDLARQLVEPFQDALLVLQRLSQRLPLIAITNGSADLKRIGWGQYFRLSISPQQALAAKPDVRIYQHACAELGVAPQEVLHVGDDPLLDVDAARRAGLEVAWINRGGAVWPGPGAPPQTFADWVVARLAQ